MVTFNQRSVAEILQMIRMLGGLVGLAERAEAYADELERGLAAMRTAGASLPHRPRVYFEEWDGPLISGIQWVEELVEIAGGQPVFPHLRHAGLAKDRIVSPEAVCEAAPDVILASWCGKRVRPEKITSRPGWDRIPAVASGRVFEIKSTIILQPGPASLTEGVQRIHEALVHH